MLKEKVLLSQPHMGGEELGFVNDSFTTNWIAPLGPNVSGFELDLENYLKIKKAVAMSSGTAAIHIALRLLGIEPGEHVFVSDLTFIASVNPILYEKAVPVLIDSEPTTWNMCPLALEKAFESAKSQNKMPKAVVVVDLYGMPADYKKIIPICEKYNVPIVEDSAESLGAHIDGKMCGTFGKFNALSFNGNKIITTGGGGMLLSSEHEAMEKALYLITQARDPAPHYQHSEMGFNYRMSNVLAGIGRGQMKVLKRRIERRREIFSLYREHLGVDSRTHFLLEPNGFFANRWLSQMAVTDSVKTSMVELNKFLNANNIESRPIWKPMHMQPLFKGCEFVSHGKYLGYNSVSEYAFNQGLCLPSSTNYGDEIYLQVIDVLKKWLDKN